MGGLSHTICQINFIITTTRGFHLKYCGSPLLNPNALPLLPLSWDNPREDNPLKNDRTGRRPGDELAANGRYTIDSRRDRSQTVREQRAPEDQVPRSPFQFTIIILNWNYCCDTRIHPTSHSKNPHTPDLAACTDNDDEIPSKTSTNTTPSSSVQLLYRAEPHNQRDYIFHPTRDAFPTTTIAYSTSTHVQTTPSIQYLIQLKATKSSPGRLSCTFPHHPQHISVSVCLSGGDASIFLSFTLSFFLSLFLSPTACSPPQVNFLVRGVVGVFRQRSKYQHSNAVQVMWVKPNSLSISSMR